MWKKVSFEQELKDENVFFSAHDRLLIEEYGYHFQSKTTKPYFLEIDFLGKIINTNGGK